MKTKKIRIALIASGGGTDADAIMAAKKEIPNMEIVLLISTKKDAGCLAKAKARDVQSITIDNHILGARFFREELTKVLRTEKIDLVFLVGCIANIPLMENIRMYNIHPADILKYGGKGMYGLEPHKKVISDIGDLIAQGKANLNDTFYTEPTIHEVIEEYDSGQYFLKLKLEIPRTIIWDFMDGREHDEPVALEVAAAKLQQHVLPFEWRMLPFAVKTIIFQMMRE